MVNETQIFQYNGSPITFQNGDSVMVNATQMAKTFGKLVGDWTRLKTTTEFMDALSADMQIPISELIQVVKGGNGEQGTWMHEDVALEFARWLSPSFAIWCNKRIKELLQYGMTATQPTLEQMINNPELVISLATQLKNEREEKIRLEQEKKQLEAQSEQQQSDIEQKQATIELQEKEIKEAAPKVEYCDKVLSSQGYLTVNMIAACLGISDRKLNQLLCQWGVQYKESGVYYLYSRYRDKGYTVHKPHAYTDNNGNIRTRQHMYWSEEGKRFVIGLYNSKMAS